ncbi:MAG: CpsD/CapB family tyrosine-protein kinase, partial [Planctomycetota bacterium]
LDEHLEIDPSICTLHRQGSRHAEAFRAIRSALYFSSSRKNYKVIQVTSPVPGDGKSTMAGNLAVAIAMSGKKVLLIDADCRRPRVNALFGLDNEVGLATVLQNESQLEDAIFFTSVENLFIMPSGPTPSNPAELLTSPGFGQLLDIVKEDFDLVIVDTPPVLPVTDAVAVAARVDAVMLAIRIRKGVQITAMRAKEVLDGVDANVMGIVVNAVDGRYGRSSYGYGYGYGKYGRYSGYGGYGDSHGYYLEDSPNGTSNGIARPKDKTKSKASNAEPLRLVSKAE